MLCYAMLCAAMLLCYASTFTRRSSSSTFSWCSHHTRTLDLVAFAAAACSEVRTQQAGSRRWPRLLCGLAAFLCHGVGWRCVLRGRMGGMGCKTAHTSAGSSLAGRIA